MSSKVHQSDETSGVEPLVWRQMQPAGPAGPAGTAVPVEEPPDSQQRLAQLQQQYEQRAREAHAAGLREGEAAGRQRASAEIQPVIDRLARSIEEIGGLRARLRAEAEADLVQLSLAIARRVLRRELAIDPEALHGLVLGALEKLRGQEISRVRVHPAHVSLLTESLRQNSAARQSGGGRRSVARPSARSSSRPSAATSMPPSIPSCRRSSVAWPTACGSTHEDFSRPLSSPNSTALRLCRWTGQVTEVVGLLVESRGPSVAIGDFCEVRTASGRRIRTQVIGFRNGRVLSMPLEEIDGLQLGDPLAARSEDARVEVGPGLLGRVIDGFGKPMDDGPALEVRDTYSLHGTATNPLDREHITQPLVTGIRAIDGLLPCGKGQRIGIFGGSGVGKSTLLGSMSRHNSADVTVIAMIGERNREVRGFLENELGPEGRKRSVVVCATSERPAPLRVRACFVALAIAEYFRDQGANVLLVMDSVTRLAMAQREIGLAAGEPPSQKGYTPSVFNLLPKVLERAGNFRRGSITGFFTVLVEGDDFNEPICDAVRGILDGHIILSRQLGAQGHYPAIDILHSVSRLTSRHRHAPRRKRPRAKFAARSPPTATPRT